MLPEPWWAELAALGILLLAAWAGYCLGRHGHLDAYERGVQAGRQGERLARYARRMDELALEIRLAAQRRQIRGAAE